MGAGAAALQSCTRYLGLTLVFIISVFQEFFAIANKILILGGRLGGWALGYHSMKVGHFHDFS